MRLGILGAGAIGEKHAKAAYDVGVQVVRVVDHDQQRASLVAGSVDAEAGTESRSLWEDQSIDAVVIGVPNSLHRQLALEALHAGKDVLLEKPMALSAEECDELIDAAERNQRILQIGYAHRFTAVGSAAKEYITTGNLGDIYHAKAHLHLRRGIPGLGRWFTTRALSGGGALIDIGVHLIDLILYLLDQPQTATVSGKAYSKFGVRMEDYVFESMWAGPPNYQGTFDVEDHATGLITFANGATLDLQVAWACNLPADTLPDSMIAVLGDRGGLSFELFGDQLKVRGDLAGRAADSQIHLQATDFMNLQMDDFVKAFETRRPQVGATPREARRVQAIVDGIYSSSQTNHPVMLEA